MGFRNRVEHGALFMSSPYSIVLISYAVEITQYALRSISERRYFMSLNTLQPKHLSVEAHFDKQHFISIVVDIVTQDETSEIFKEWLFTDVTDQLLNILSNCPWSLDL